jgi:hypothetical protein
MLLMGLMARADAALAASILFVIDDSPGFQALVPTLKRSFRSTSNVIRIAHSEESVAIFSAVAEDVLPGQRKTPSADRDTLRLWVESADHTLDALCKRADVVVVGVPNPNYSQKRANLV